MPTWGNKIEKMNNRENLNLILQAILIQYVVLPEAVAAYIFLHLYHFGSWIVPFGI